MLGGARDWLAGLGLGEFGATITGIPCDVQSGTPDASIRWA